MSQAAFKAALSAEGWSQEEMDNLWAMLVEISALGDIHKQAKLHFSAAISRWNTGISTQVATLPALFEIPNPLNLAGTQAITKENLTANLMAYATTVQSLGSQGHLDNILPLVGNVNV